MELDGHLLFFNFYSRDHPRYFFGQISEPSTKRWHFFKLCLYGINWDRITVVEPIVDKLKNHISSGKILSIKDCCGHNYIPLNLDVLSILGAFIDKLAHSPIKTLKSARNLYDLCGKL